MFEVLTYNGLYVSRELQAKFERTVNQLAAGDFRAAEVKKLKPTAFLRAKLDDSNRLLFTFVRSADRRHLLLLEVIYNHDYSKSRFLHGAPVDESKIETLTAPPVDTEADGTAKLTYLNPKSRNVCVLDKILSFDDIQEGILHTPPPLIIIGSAGSGKTVLTLEKLKQLRGDILYVTHSPFLAENASTLYYANNYANDHQKVEFLSFRELLESVRIHPGREATWHDFSTWFNRHRLSSPVRNGHQLYEEFKGVLTGSITDRPALTREQYLNLGVRQSIFPSTERGIVHDLFTKYQAFLHEGNLYDLNVACFETLPLCRPRYDFAVVDEVQDLTIVQVRLILNLLRTPNQFVFCGDSNQIVHPNFFSWAQVKSFFYHQKTDHAPTEILRILNTNYRNSPAVTAIANRLLLLKNARFGSIDKESNYLVRANSAAQGKVELLPDSDTVKRDLNQKTKLSTQFAVIIMRDEDKPLAAKHFDTPLLFSIHEAKGLEYPNIILHNFVSGCAREFADIADGVTEADLTADELTYRRARDKGDKTLEAYKFYVNSLYVAMTRAVRNLFVVEGQLQHPLLKLLGMRGTAAAGISTQASSKEEWGREARRLELQGKQEQADAIRSKVLGNVPVPWEVLTRERLPAFCQEAFNPEHFNKKAKELLFDYATIYELPSYFPLLVEAKYTRAARYAEERAAIHDKYIRLYRDRAGKFNDLWQLIGKHGVDFRNPLNQTPLMLAAQTGAAPLVQRLIAEGANRDARDNYGRNAVQITLDTALAPTPVGTAYLNGPMAEIYQAVAPSSIRFRVFQRLFKVDSHSMEFFLFNYLLARFKNTLHYDSSNWIQAGFTAPELTAELARLPDLVLPPYRKLRPYVSSILCKNECFRLGEATACRAILLRVERGRYLLNPALAVERNGDWINLLDLVDVDALTERQQDPKQAKAFVAFLREARQQLEPLDAEHADDAQEKLVKLAGDYLYQKERSMAKTAAQSRRRTAPVKRENRTQSLRRMLAELQEKQLRTTQSRRTPKASSTE